MNSRIKKGVLIYLAVEVLTTVAFGAGMLLGMEFDPNSEYCSSRTHLFPDCHYEQSTDQPGDEVCK